MGRVPLVTFAHAGGGASPASAGRFVAGTGGRASRPISGTVSGIIPGSAAESLGDASLS